MDIGRSCRTTFSIVNRQPAVGNENLVFGCGYAALHPLDVKTRVGLHHLRSW
jgi:hypothetical protein